MPPAEFRELKAVRCGWIDVDDANPRQRRLRVKAGPIHALDPADGLWKTLVDTAEGGEDEVRHATGRVRAIRSTGKGGINDDAGALAMSMSVRAQKRTAGKWGVVPLTLDATVTKETAKRVWRYTDGVHVLRLVLDMSSDAPKWTYTFKAGTPGRFRLRIVVTPAFSPTDSFTTAGKDGSTTSARWRSASHRYRYSWRDMARQIASFDMTADELTLVGDAVNMAAGEVMKLDPTLDQDAGWSADMSRTTGAAFPDDGSDLVGWGFSTPLSTVFEFDVSSLAGTDTITSAKLFVHVGAVVGSPPAISVGPYSDTGDDDPSTDSNANRLTRADIIGSAVEYLTGLTIYQSTGGKTTADMGAQSHTDIEAAVDGSGQMSIVLMYEGSLSNDNSSSLTEYSDATASERPELQLVYTTAGGGGRIMSSLVANGGLIGAGGLAGAAGGLAG